VSGPSGHRVLDVSAGTGLGMRVSVVSGMFLPLITSQRASTSSPTNVNYSGGVGCDVRVVARMSVAEQAQQGAMHILAAVVTR
jgi:hypothetical protein